VYGCSVDRSPAAPWGRAPIGPGASACDVRVSWDSEGLAYPALLDPLWSSAASMSEARESFASAVLEDGRVLVAGGASRATGVMLASAELYDPDTNTWSVTGSMSVDRGALTLTALSGDSSRAAIAIGGRDSEGELSSSELYNAETGAWIASAELPMATAEHAAVLLDNGDLLVAGGSAGTATALLAEGASAWISAGELIAEEPGSTLTALADGSALLIGPTSPGAQRYVPGLDGWLAAGEPRVTRTQHTATRLLDGTVLIVGGAPVAREPDDAGVEEPPAAAGLRSVELYDPAVESFSLVGATSEARSQHTATLLSDGRVAVFGGRGVSGPSGTELYNATWGTWTQGPGTAQGRSAHQAALLADGRLLTIGGVAPSGTVLASSDRLDPTTIETIISEYKLPARRDRDVTASTITELWAAVARPATLAEGRRYPVLVFLHGNHGTCGVGENPRQDFDCTYTQTGSCPEGSVVVPSHRGYDYVMNELAARGFIVVSVNANRGITCGFGEDGDFGFNLARGKLLLKHLQLLSQWNRGIAETPASVGASLEGKLDFTQLGMMGHSRGGEGVRAAYEQYRDTDSPWPRRIGEPVVFRALFEIGAVDGQTSRVLNADGTVWNALLPMCDGDVSDLQGVKPFDRMLALRNEARETAKSTYVAWGTNHNYFNTEWQTSDSPGCSDHRAVFEDGPGITGSAEQRQIGLRSMLTFFLANVGVSKNTSLSRLFDPTSPLETDTRIDRAYTPGLRPSRGVTIEDFTGPTGRTERGLPTQAQSVEVTHESVPEHDETLRAAVIEWPSEPEPSGIPERFFEVPVSAAAAGIDVSRFTHLEFRVGRLGADDLSTPTPLLVQLVASDGSLSAPVDVAISDVLLDGPVGGPFSTHLVLQTARLRLTDFASDARRALRAVRFSFPTAQGAQVYLTGLRVSLGTAALSPVPSAAPRLSGIASAQPAVITAAIERGTRPASPRQVITSGNRQVALRAVDGRIELELETQTAFRAQNDVLLLELGSQRVLRSGHPGGSLQRVVFTLDPASFNALPDNAPVRVRYASNDARQWDFGVLDKSHLRPE
jgi:hypothetical protein